MTLRLHIKLVVLFLILWSGMIGFIRLIAHQSNAPMLAFANYPFGRIESDIFVLDQQRNLIINLTKHPAHDTEPVWSPDGDRLAFVSDRSGVPQVYVMSATGHRIKPMMSNTTTISNNPSWSPDSTQLIATTDSNLAITSVQEQSSWLRLIDDSAVDSYPHWSSDGQSIVFQSNRGGVYALHFYDMATGQLESQRISQNENLVHPKWSPDGRYIAYHQSSSFQWFLSVVDLEAQERRELYAGVTIGAGLSWTNDGKSIYFVPDSPLLRGLHTINIESGEITKVLDYGFHPHERP